MRELGNICISGATGFLGIHVLRAFLQLEKGTAFCVVRGRKTITAQKHLCNMLNYYFSGEHFKIDGKPFHEAIDDLLGNRIVVIDGSITDPKLYEQLESRFC